MADTQEMLRIIRHAAHRLDQEDPGRNAREVGRLSGTDSVVSSAVTRAQSETLAMAYASAVLQMVAACMDEEPAAALTEPPAGAGGAFNAGALYAALDERRQAQGASWRAVATAAGVAPSLFTKLSQGGTPSADVLVRLLGWLGTTELAPFLAEVVP